MTTRRPQLHYLADSIHYCYDKSIPPALTIAPGDTVVIGCREAADGQFTPDSTTALLKTLDWNRIHALTGPIFVEGAAPGDVLAVEVLEIAHHGWGWTCVLPGFGLLAEDFGDAERVRIWEVGEDGRGSFLPGVRVPVEPFMGEMGVAWAEPGRHPTMPPTLHGGNLDCRHTCVGATVYFPVEVEGALFSTGDGHLAQGDGEVCGIAMEAPLEVTMRFEVLKGESIPCVRFDTRGPTTSKVDGLGHYVTSGIGPDLHRSAQDAVRRMIDLLEARKGLDRIDAYMLCSVAGDLKIAVPVLGDGHESHVTFHMPKSVFV